MFERDAAHVVAFAVPHSLDFDESRRFAITAPLGGDVNDNRRNASEKRRWLFGHAVPIATMMVGTKC